MNLRSLFGLRPKPVVEEFSFGCRFGEKTEPQIDISVLDETGRAVGYCTTRNPDGSMQYIMPLEYIQVQEFKVPLNRVRVSGNPGYSGTLVTQSRS